MQNDKKKTEGVRLNKYIANAGVCSRRDADKLIEGGKISVNGKIVKEMGVKIYPTDKVLYKGKKLKNEKFVYVLLNKPKGFITTMHDPEGRKTVMSLVKHACEERIYPVGRLDRNTTGLLLFTNDGEVAKKLTHPRHRVKKIYHVELSEPLEIEDFNKIKKGLILEDGKIEVDQLEYIDDGKDKSKIGVEIHSGRNRIVRRIFESLEYKVVKLDRIYFAGLTKKNISRSRWKFLSEEEISYLKRIQ